MTEAGLKEDNATNRAELRKKLISYTGDPRRRDKPWICSRNYYTCLQRPHKYAHFADFAVIFHGHGNISARKMLSIRPVYTVDARTCMEVRPTETASRGLRICSRASVCWWVLPALLWQQIQIEYAMHYLF